MAAVASRLLGCGDRPRVRRHRVADPRRREPALDVRAAGIRARRPDRRRLATATASRSPTPRRSTGRLRLTPDEALALIAALRALSDVPGIVSTAAIDRALAKLEGAAGSTTAADKVVVAPTSSADTGVVTTITDALAQIAAACTCATGSPRATRPPNATSIRSGCSPATQRRTSQAGATRVEDLRTFRLDRVLDAAVLDDADRCSRRRPGAGARRRAVHAVTRRPARHLLARPGSALGWPTTTSARKSKSAATAGWS